MRSAVSEAIECVDPRPLVDGWVTSMDGTDSAALVREKCTHMRDHSVLSWRPGKHVRTNCASIPRWTAIASFVDGEYRGRAAIFESCDFLGIWVSQPLALARRHTRAGKLGKERGPSATMN
ncbi:hypothetical protein HPB48_013898 [Haemaphysalis longicornis]|uniref:Uncharacterized protein n=1 Tax=Haemaphysalis longicornis TaxID=44386 RepID=A0A9J6G3S2_HAELO|nr:hypothetical protein HPB48_013898 [Haemaphysalis longicornis]